jgi:DNA polymerase III delta subunit
MASKSASKVSLDAGMRIVILHGKELFLLDEYTRRLEVALSDVHGEIEHFRFDGTTVTLAVVLDELRSWGLIQTHKLVIVDNASDFMQVAGNRPAMERYAESPMEEATLVLRSREWRPGNFDKAVKKVGTAVKCDIPNDADALHWCVARALKEHKAILDPDAAHLLVDRIGPVLSRLDGEMAKLVAAAADDETTPLKITREAVIELVGLGREEKAWLIQEPILRGDPAAAIQKLMMLYDVARAPSVLLMWACLDLARMVHEAAIRLERGEAPGSLAKPLRLWGPAARAVPKVAQRLGSGVTGVIFDELLDLDRRAKTGRMPAFSDAPGARESTRRTLECVAVRMADRFG